MALLADIPPETVRSVLQRIDERLLRETTEPEAARLMSSTLLLAGLRFEKETLHSLLFGVRTMNLLNSKIIKDSSAYPLLLEMLRPEMEEDIRAEMKVKIRAEIEEKIRAEIMEEKLRAEMKEKIRAEIEEKIRADESRSLLIAMAADRFGAPTEPQKTLLDGIEDHDRLVRLCKKVGSLSTWEELLGSESAS
jgi:hypothetical protein